jgi:excisionase family DNA binding protein
LAATEERAEIARLLPKSEVAKLLGISPRSLYRLVADGKFPAPIKLGQLSRWRQSDVQQWIVSQSAQTGR